ncbi:hypothetical protein GGI20_003345 [Coemansia sp. BCRC 34301]|nr:hypothetical protein GGI20_003345 [Coemansia sp. BCRC 34301]
MSDTDDFNYDSVVSDPGVYITGFLDATNTSSNRQAQRQADTNLLTPVADARAQTPPPRQDYGINDSTPSLAVSTPNSEKFHIEFEHEQMNNQLGNGSTQSHFGLKSGMYNNRPADATESTADFSAK